MFIEPHSPSTQTTSGNSLRPWQCTLRDKLILLKEFRIGFPAFRNAMDEVTEMIELGDCALGFSGVFIIGESGSGKTTFLETLVERYPTYEVEDRTVRPAVMVSIPSVPSIKFIARRILAKLGDPLAYAPRRDNDELTKAIITLLKGCGSQVLLLDEINNFLQKKGRHDSVLDLSNWLKEIVDDSKVLVVLSALPIGEAVVQLNEQLERRFSAPLHLELVKKYKWEDNSADFRGVLKEIDGKLPTMQRSRLHGENMAQRLFFASDGRIGLLMKLLKRAIRIAHKKEVPHLDLAILEEAFTIEIWGEGVGPLNPFNQQFVRRRLNKPGEIYAPKIPNAMTGGRGSK